MVVPGTDLLRPREAAQLLGVSYPTLKQWIYRKKIQTVRTAGGHHRIPRSEVDRWLRHTGASAFVARNLGKRISGRNQLIGRVVEIRRSGLLAQVKLSISGQTVTSLITADAVRAMGLKVGDLAAALIKSTEVMIILP
ncbi:MAG: helix-turn-helix domain-containing protein [Acidobacteria bacterium]|nr:MAG: helix-turn-helix domain-containing protein [Acidobacteriota bacterium]